MKYLRRSWISCSLLVVSFSLISYSSGKLQALPLTLIQTPIESSIPNTVQDKDTKTNKTTAQSFAVCEGEDYICQIIDSLITQDQNPTFFGHFLLAGGLIILIALMFKHDINLGAKIPFFNLTTITVREVTANF
jgi:hypothetical protein